MVRRDDLGGLVRLIALQKASARDCDADGGSLLFVSTPAIFYDLRPTVLSRIASMLLSQCEMLQILDRLRRGHQQS